MVLGRLDLPVQTRRNSPEVCRGWNQVGDGNAEREALQGYGRSGQGAVFPETSKNDTSVSLGGSPGLPNGWGPQCFTRVEAASVSFREPRGDGALKPVEAYYPYPGPRSAQRRHGQDSRALSGLIETAL